MMPLLVAIFAGAAVIVAILGARPWLMERYRSDVVRLQTTWFRFHTTPMNAEAGVIAIYVLLAGMLALLLMTMPNVIIALILWALLVFMPKLLVEAMWQRRKTQIDQQLPAAISTMCNSIRAGLTLVQALQRLGEQAMDPIRIEFKIMANRYAYGADLESTIREAKERLALPNFNLFASALLLNREMGGDIAETLNRISKSLDRLQHMRKTVEAHTSEGRTNIKVLLIAPVFMLLMIAAVDAEAVTMLFTTFPGKIILLIAATLSLAGVYFAWRITRSEV